MLHLVRIKVSSRPCVQVVPQDKSLYLHRDDCCARSPAAGMKTERQWSSPCPNCCCDDFYYTCSSRDFDTWLLDVQLSHSCNMIIEKELSASVLGVKGRTTVAPTNDPSCNARRVPLLLCESTVSFAPPSLVNQCFSFLSRSPEFFTDQKAFARIPRSLFCFLSFSHLFKPSSVRSRSGFTCGSLFRVVMTKPRSMSACQLSPALATHRNISLLCS